MDNHEITGKLTVSFGPMLTHQFNAIRRIHISGNKCKITTNRGRDGILISFLLSYICVLYTNVHGVGEHLFLFSKSGSEKEQYT